MRPQVLDWFPKLPFLSIFLFRTLINGWVSCMSNLQKFGTHLGLLFKVPVFSRLDLNRWIWCYSPSLVTISEEWRVESLEWASSGQSNDQAAVLLSSISSKSYSRPWHVHWKTFLLFLVLPHFAEIGTAKGCFTLPVKIWDLSHACFLFPPLQVMAPGVAWAFPSWVTQSPPPADPCPSGFSSDLRPAWKHKVEEMQCVFCSAVARTADIKGWMQVLGVSMDQLLCLFGTRK